MKALPKPLSAVVALLLANIIMIPVARMQENDGRNDDLGAWTSEHNMRLEATKIVLPVYPEDALSKGAEGIVVVRVGADAGGEVAKVRTPPDINPLFRKEAVIAARQWRFKPHHLLRPGKYLVSRLTFRFFIKDGKGEVELYSPPWDSAEGERLRGAGERADAEWRRWEAAVGRCRGREMIPLAYTRFGTNA